MRSVGIDLQPHVDAGLLRFEAARPSLYGLEMHLARMNRDIERFEPARRRRRSDLGIPRRRIRDPRDPAPPRRHLQGRGITAVFTSLSLAADSCNEADRGVSSLMDTWISLTDVEANGERNRVLYVLKSRGMKPFQPDARVSADRHGIELIEPYIGPHGVLTGAARLAQEARERGRAARRRQQDRAPPARHWPQARGRRAQIAELRAALEAEEEEIADPDRRRTTQRESASRADRAAMAAKRGASQ